MLLSLHYHFKPWNPQAVRGNSSDLEQKGATGTPGGSVFLAGGWFFRKRSPVEELKPMIAGLCFFLVIFDELLVEIWMKPGGRF